MQSIFLATASLQVVRPFSKRRATVRNFLIPLLVVAVAVVAVGFWRGWFEMGGERDEGKVEANLNVNVGKFKEDKEKFKKTLSEKAKAMKNKLASLKDKSKGLSGEAKAKAEKEHEALTKKYQELENKMKDVENSREEKFDDVRKSIAGAFDEDKPGDKGEERDKHK
jgi:hypothetical protein